MRASLKLGESPACAARTGHGVRPPNGASFEGHIGVQTDAGDCEVAVERGVQPRLPAIGVAHAGEEERAFVSVGRVRRPSANSPKLSHRVSSRWGAALAVEAVVFRAVDRAGGVQNGAGDRAIALGRPCAARSTSIRRAASNTETAVAEAPSSTASPKSSRARVASRRVEASAWFFSGEKEAEAELGHDPSGRRSWRTARWACSPVQRQFSKFNSSSTWLGAGWAGESMAACG